MCQNHPAILIVLAKTQNLAWPNAKTTLHRDPLPALRRRYRISWVCERWWKSVLNYRMIINLLSNLLPILPKINIHLYQHLSWQSPCFDDFDDSPNLVHGRDDSPEPLHFLQLLSSQVHILKTWCSISTLCVIHTYSHTLQTQQPQQKIDRVGFTTIISCLVQF
jgi:hypothetical protein